MTGEALAGMRTVNVDCLFNVPTKYGIIGVGILLKTDASNEKGKVVVGKMVNETPDKGATLFRMASEAPEITVGHESSLCRQVEALYGLGARPEARSQQRHPAIELDRKSTRLNSSHSQISY